MLNQGTYLVNGESNIVFVHGNNIGFQESSIMQTPNGISTSLLVPELRVYILAKEGTLKEKAQFLVY